MIQLTNKEAKEITDLLGDDIANRILTYDDLRQAWFVTWADTPKGQQKRNGQQLLTKPIFNQIQDGQQKQVRKASQSGIPILSQWKRGY